MATQTFDSAITPRKNFFPWISWSAIFGGLASGISIFILLSLLGLASGFSAMNPQAGEPVGSVPAVTGIWTGISMMIAAFFGGYVTASISGLSRRNDGIFHGLVVWGVNTVLFFYLITTSVGSLLGGAFNALGQGVQTASNTVSGVVGGATTGSQNMIGQLEVLITGKPGGNISQQDLSALDQQLSAGNRQGAINVLVTQMGFTQDRAQLLVDQALPIYSAVQQLPSGENVVASTVSGLTTASWYIFGAVLLSMLLSIAGGWLGSRTVVRRRVPIAH